MQARLADHEGFVEHGGVKIHYEVYGDGMPTILLLPTWTIVHKRFWKMQVAYLSRHFRVVLYDGPGNGRSDRPTDPGPYEQDAQVAYLLAVLDATGTDRAVTVGLSKAANWALQLAADHADRVLGTVLIGPTVHLGDPDPHRAKHPSLDGPLPELTPSRVPAGGQDPPSDWAKYHRGYWQERYEDFLWFFLGQCFPEPHSTKAIEDGVGWGLETTGAVLVADSLAPRPDRAAVVDWCTRIRGPVLSIHGDQDRISPSWRSEHIAELTGGQLALLAGSGHIPQARDPVRVNLLIREFAERFRPAPARPWVRGNRRPKRVLYISSPIGLGHARRDVAIAAELRRRHPDVQIDWLAQHPVTRLLERVGERVHPASAALAIESAHIEDEAAEHDLHCFQALRTMDEILLANFMVFHDLVETGDYDLVVGDESWDVDYFLHENPELKRFGYAWMTDFVGYLPMPDGGDREAYVAADYNAEMIEQIERYPRIRDRAVFVGDPEDIVDEQFGPDLPPIRDWTERHYDFAGYVTGFDPDQLRDPAELRAELGYRPDERVCVVTVGGSGVGGNLLRRIIDAYPEAARRVPGLRMVVVAGPRIDPASLPSRPGLEVRAYVPDLHRHLAACDLAIVQGGLTTCMELTATRRPFIYVPLRHHFEQQFHVAHRLRRYRAGRRLDYHELNPETLAAAIQTEIGRKVSYHPVAPDGAAHAAALLAELL
jgi:pimeloyl-ACP methyl ester carboxylesterase/predicted glycosyltransferase